MKVMVTGGAGFIGSNLIDHLIENGYDVVSVDINPDGYWNDKSENYIGDVCDFALIEKLTKGVDFIFHLAAETQIQVAIENPEKCYSTNIMGTCSVLNSARKNNIKKVILSSTSAIYKCDWTIQPEDSKENCLNPYSDSKKSSEEMCKLYSKLYGVDTIIFRYFNVYGNRQHTEGQYAPVIGIFLRQYEKGEPLTIVGDGSQKRDFIHIDDVINANMLAIEKETKPGSIYNVGSGNNISIQKLADIISPNQSYIEKRLGEINSTCATIHSIEKDLNWSPTINFEKWLKKKISDIKL